MSGASTGWSDDLLLLKYRAISGTRTGGSLVLTPRKLESQGIKS